MKKIIGIIFSSFLILIILLLVYSNHKKVKLEFYSPKESKAYVTLAKRELTFDIYSFDQESLITYKEQNIYTLYLDNMSFVLDDIRVSEFDLKDYKIIRIYSKMPNIPYSEYNSDTSILEIKNPKYTLKLSYGSMSFLKEDTYPLLSIDDLYGSYSYMNNTLIMCGINITLTNKYSYISSVRIGFFSYGVLSNVLFDTFLDNICEIDKVIGNYNPKRVELSNPISFSSNKLFIPSLFLADVDTNIAPNSFAKSLASPSSTTSCSIKSDLFPAIANIIFSGDESLICPDQ